MKKQKTLKQRFNHGFMNVFAVVMTLMPLLSMGLWMQTTLMSDQRKVQELDYLAAPEVDPFGEPLITVTFDDGWESVYSAAAPLLQKHQIPTTQYLLTGMDKDPAYLSPEQMASLKKAGHEIGSHGIMHLDLATLDALGLDRELRESKSVFQQRNLVGKSVHFASPFNSFNTTTIDQISKYYYSHRNTYANLKEVGPEDMNIGPELNRYQIVGYSVTNETSDDELRRAIAYAKAHNGWFVLVYHQVDDSGGRYAVTSQTFERQLKIIKDSGVKTPTLGNVLAELEVEGRI